MNNLNKLVVGVGVGTERKTKLIVKEMKPKIEYPNTFGAKVAPGIVNKKVKILNFALKKIKLLD